MKGGEGGGKQIYIWADGFRERERTRDKMEERLRAKLWAYAMAEKR